MFYILPLHYRVYLHNKFGVISDKYKIDCRVKPTGMNEIRKVPRIRAIPASKHSNRFIHNWLKIITLIINLSIFFVEPLQ